VSGFLRVLSAISEGLLIPVVSVLLLLSGITVFSLGAVAHEAWERFRCRDRRSAWIRAAQSRRTAAQTLQAIAGERRAPDHLARFARTGLALLPYGSPADPAAALKLERAVVEVEQAMTRRIDRSTPLVRLGPMLGLMGTLIPMGPAMGELAHGKMTALTGDLVIAFTTTVLGLGIGSVAAVLASVRSNWYAADLSDIEYLTGWFLLASPVAILRGDKIHDSDDVATKRAMAEVTRTPAEGKPSS